MTNAAFVTDARTFISNLCPPNYCTDIFPLCWVSHCALSMAMTAVEQPLPHGYRSCWVLVTAPFSDFIRDSAGFPLFLVSVCFTILCCFPYLCLYISQESLHYTLLNVILLVSHSYWDPEGTDTLLEVLLTTHIIFGWPLALVRHISD